MPRKRRIAKQQRHREFGDEQLRALVTGLDYFGYTDFTDAKEREDAMREDWLAHRKEILAGFIAENPGERPWAWWKFDSPEQTRRKVNAGGEVVFPGMRPCPDAPISIRFGLPAHWIVAGGHENRYESEAEFLARHKLLTAKEKKQLGKPVGEVIPQLEVTVQRKTGA